MSIDPRECEHPDFVAEVTVNRIMDRDPVRFVADVRVDCAACGQKFGFVGLPKRISTELPGTSATRLEAMLPIEPVDPGLEVAKGGTIQIDPL